MNWEILSEKKIGEKSKDEIFYTPEISYESPSYNPETPDERLPFKPETPDELKDIDI